MNFNILKVKERTRVSKGPTYCFAPGSVSKYLVPHPHPSHPPYTLTPPHRLIPNPMIPKFISEGNLFILSDPHSFTFFSSHAMRPNFLINWNQTCGRSVSQLGVSFPCRIELQWQQFWRTHPSFRFKIELQSREHCVRDLHLSPARKP